VVVGLAEERERDASGGGGGRGSRTFDVVVGLAAERETHASGGVLVVGWRQKQMQNRGGTEAARERGKVV